MAQGNIGSSSATSGVAMNRWNGYMAKGATTQNGGTLAENVLYLAKDTAVGSSLISSYRSEQNSGSGRWAFQSTGTANSGFAGAVRIGDTAAPATANGLEVVGDTKIQGELDVRSPGVNVAGLISNTKYAIHDPLGWAWTGAGGLNFYYVLAVDGTLTDSNTTAPNTIQLFRATPTIDRTTTASMSSFTGLLSTPTVRANGTGITSGNITHVSLGTTYNTTGGGTLTGVTDNGVTLGLTITAGTIATRTGVYFGEASGAGTLTDQYAIDIAALTKGATTNVSLRSQGTAAQMRHAGPAIFGANAATTSPVIMEVRQPTVGNEAMRIDSVATNDDPTEKTFQCRLATTDATQTNCFTIAVASGRALTMNVSVVAHCTGGASCTANESAGYQLNATCKNNAGTTAIVGSAIPIAENEDVSTWDATIDCDNATDTARLRLTGAATTTITWHATIRTMDVGT
jgi:hypothetical protein